MKIQTLFNFFMKIGLWPFKFNDNGDVKMNWKVLIYISIHLILNTIFMSWIYANVGGMPLNFQETLEIAFVSLATTIPGQQAIVGFTAKCIGSHLQQAKNDVINNTTLLGLNLAIFLILGSIWYSRFNFLFKLEADVEYFLLVIGLIIMESALAIAYLIFFGVVTLILKEILKNGIEKLKLDLNDVNCTTKTVQSFERGICILGWWIIPATQVVTIFTIYCLVSDIRNFYFSFYVVGLTIFLVFFIGQLETCYDLVKELAARAKRESVNAGSMKEMFQMQIAADELKACCPFTANNFFKLDRETLTAMLATTITYLVVLMQL